MIAARWRVLAAYTALQALMQFEWLRFAPVTDAAAAHYRVSLAAIGNLSLVFPLLFLPLALPVGAWLDRLPVRTTLRLSAAGMVIAALLRVLGPGYGWLLAGQVLFALLQPLVMALVARLAAVWFDERQRLLATAIPSMAIFIGIGLAYVLVPAIGPQGLWFDVVLLAVIAVLVWLAVARDPVAPAVTGKVRRAWRREFGAIIRTPAIAALLVYFFLANGFFNVVATWLQPILGRHAVDPELAGVVALCMLASGVVAMAFADRIVRWLTLHQLLLVAPAGALIATAAFFATGSIALLVVAAILLGATLLAPLPILIDAVAKAAGEARAATAAALLWLVGNAGAVCLLAAFDPIANGERWSLGGIVLAVVLILQGASALRVHLDVDRA